MIDHANVSDQDDDLDLDAFDSVDDETEILTGRTIAASYHRQVMPEYMGNPMIEALPDHSISPLELIQQLGNDIMCTPECREAADRLRIDMAERLNHFILPQRKMRKLFNRIGTMIRTGYVGRNPRNVSAWMRVHRDAMERLELVDQEKTRACVGERTRCHSMGMSVVGPSGVGKSSAVSRVLLTFPQLIRHRDADAKHPVVDQLVWLVTTCPENGGAPALCSAILSAFDAILGTSYEGDATRRGLTAIQMKRLVISLSHTHALGLLVLDEVQLLSSAKSGNGQLVMDLLLTLMNELKVPVLLVGTGQAVEILSSKLQNARRFVGKGLVWMDPMGRHDEFPQFVEMLWDRCFLRDMPSFSELLAQEAEDRANGTGKAGEATKILDAIYSMTAGVHDLVVRLFVLGHEAFFAIQEEHLLDNPDAMPLPETFSVEVFEQVYRDDFRLLAPFVLQMLQGLSVDEIEFEKALGKRKRKSSELSPSLRGSEKSSLEEYLAKGRPASPRSRRPKTGVGQPKEPVVDEALRKARRATALRLVGDGLVNRSLLEDPEGLPAYNDPRKD